MRPCTCEQTGSCRLCYLYHHDARYRRLWDGESQQPPSLAQKAVSFIGAVVNHAASGFAQAAPEELAKRQAICGTCPELSNGRCLKCGCNAALKAAWESSKCPLGKW